MLKLGYFIVPPILVVFFLAPHFMPPLSNLWPWLLLVPTLVLLASGVISLLSRTHTLSDGTKVSRSEHIKRLRVCLDQHDTRYRIGGWDKPIRPHNAPLYIAAELDDIATVRQLLSEQPSSDPAPSEWIGRQESAVGQRGRCPKAARRGCERQQTC